MSQENVEIVRHLYESGTPDVEYVNPPYAVEPGVRHGIAAVGQAMRRFAQGWESSRHGRIARFEWGQDLDTVLKVAGYSN